jgi:hypothetical protein
MSIRNSLSQLKGRKASRSHIALATWLSLSPLTLATAQEANPPAAAAADAKAPAFKVKTIDPALCNDKRRKDKAELLNPEKFDIAALESYYRECLFVRLTQPEALSMNQAREELMLDIDTIERKSKGSQEMLGEYNKMLARQLRELIAKDKDGKSYHPSARVIGAVAAARMNRQPQTPQSGGLPDPEGSRILIGLLVPTENDGMVTTALSHLPRHWIWPGMDERLMESAKTKFISNIQAFNAAQQPGSRGKEEDAFIKEMMIENLTLITTGKGDSAKQALPVLIPMLSPAILNAKTESEWLVEKALWSFGQLATVELKPEEVKALEKGAAQFISSSLDSWTKRCNQTTVSAPSGYMGRSGGPGGSGGPGAGGPPGTGGPGGVGGLVGGDEGGGAGGPPGFTANAPKPKNPYDEQPKEVRNARRMLQQRLERIHYGLNGFGKKSTTLPVKGLVAWADESDKDKIAGLVSRIESLQDLLNSDKLTGLDKIQSMTRRPIYDLQQACTAITGDEAVAVIAPPPVDETTESETSEDGFGGK